MTESTLPANEIKPRRFPRVLWVLPAAALVLAGLVAYRHLRPPPPPVSPDALSAMVRGAPAYTLYDQHSRIVRLDSFRSRHKMLIVFVKTPGSKPNPNSDSKPATEAKSAEVEPKESDLLQTIRRDYATIQQTGAILHVISDTTPWNNRQKEGREQRFPFAILSDLDGDVHRQWNAYDSRTEKLLEAVCVVDRRGFIVRTFLGPDQLGTTAQWVEALKSIR